LGRDWLSFLVAAHRRGYRFRGIAESLRPRVRSRLPPMPSLSAVLLVLIGSLAGIGLQTVIVAIRDKRRELRDMRAAARITATDFDRAANYMGAVAELAWFDPQADLSIPAWDEHRTLLARLIDDPRDWQQLEIAVWTARDVEIEARARIEQGTQRLNDTDSLILREETKVIQGRGYARLRALSEDPSLRKRVRRKARQLLFAWRYRKLTGVERLERELNELFN